MRKNLHWNSKIYDKYMYLIIIDKVLMRSSWTLMCLKSSEYLWILYERCFSEGCVVRSSTQKERIGRRMEWSALWAEIEQIYSKSFKIFYLFLFVFLYFSFGANGATSYT